MPLFDCYCLNCDDTYEALIPLEELQENISCPQCGQILSRLMSAPYFVVR